MLVSVLLELISVLTQESVLVSVSLELISVLTQEISSCLQVAGLRGLHPGPPAPHHWMQRLGVLLLIRGLLPHLLQRQTATLQSLQAQDELNTLRDWRKWCHNAVPLWLSPSQP